ncbi:hypothetical protein [Oryzomonas rubra]|uniref:Uncharacterized protein n=1 Tax=Oryzomonas rubra TaxID=2509454 RepID=A0A5A9X7S3_9BACT|nr:hypothetical protein [Oryzomonas rubra]KAA0889076.1 hypothetical protein ET418_14600 [Oryzomonas rubra]
MLKFLKVLFGDGGHVELVPASSSQNNQEQPFKHPSKAQLEECDRLGLEVKTGMSSRDIWQMVNDAKKDPRIKALDNAYLAQQRAIQEAEDREEYGDVIVDNFKRMEALCRAGVHHIVIFKKGKQVDADVFEFESANIDDENEKKISVMIEGYRPKIYKPRGDSPHIDWNKEIVFKSDQILEVETLPTPIDLFDIDSFEKAQERANQLKQKYL